MPDTRPPALQLAPTTYSPSLLEDALACPYKAALTRHFGLREWEAFNALPNAREFGLILHSALEDFWQTWPSRTVTPADRGAAEDALTTFFAKHLKRQAEELTPLWQPRLTRLAPALVEDWIESGEAGYHVQAAEEEITEVVSGLTVKARVDRLDVNTKTNALTVIDFKSGSTPSPKQLKTGEKPQLAIEGALFQAQEKDLENLRYVRLKGYGKEMILTEDMADVPAAIAAAEEGLGRLKNVLTTSWQATPNLSEGGREKAGHCTYCPHNGVCRFQEIGW
ncbi:MAG: hypothetical protein COY40_00940 [Alphaproteobacteria bacterium CG_4_10_14_0_8_um_filter_53_9]|nr:MAG: hypothetical protein COY40_00940 [Alphaproteobacteria bacterium CG_4_10_14_0_8_um_filter_53_9]